MQQEWSFPRIKLLILAPHRTMLRSLHRATSASSFTLIELLIVIGILAVLVAAVVVVLNPAQLLAQARDSKRQQDLSALSSALNTVTALDQTLSVGSSSVVYTSLPDSSSTCGSWGLPTLPSPWKYNCVPTSTLQNTDGTGWIPVNFKTNGVVNLSSLPTDPQNTSSTGLYYTYVTGGSYELTAAFESSKYRLGGNNDQVSTDGGSYPDLYEVGSNLSLQPLDHGDPSLVGYWPLNEGTGTIAYDRSGNNNNGTWSGTTAGQNGTYYTISNGRTVGYFDGATNYINCGTSSSVMPDAFTVIGWIKEATTTPGRGTLFGFNSNYGLPPYIYLPYGGSSVGPSLASSDGIYRFANGSSPVSLFDMSWHLFAVTVPGFSSSDVSGAKIYADATLESNQYTGGSANQTAKSGCWISGFWHFNGLMRGVSLYNRALSASEIQALYNATK